jgi:ribonuclease HI
MGLIIRAVPPIGYSPFWFSEAYAIVPAMAGFIDHVKLFTDGGCRGNPGPGAIGIIILDGDNTELHAHAECIGDTTNNRAEYNALIKGLRLCARYTRGRVTCYLDSELVVKQMKGHYRLKNEELLALFQKVKDLERIFTEVIYQHVSRTNQFIKKADRLLNEAFEGR